MGERFNCTLNLRHCPVEVKNKLHKKCNIATFASTAS